MSTFHSLQKVVKETDSSTCTRFISVEHSPDGIVVEVREFLTDWVKPSSNTSQKVSSRQRRNVEDAEAYARHLIELSLKDGFVRAPWPFADPGPLSLTSLNLSAGWIA